MDGRAFDGLVTIFKVLIGICVISVPLGLWKMVDLIVWASHHVNVNVH
jgi:hypothetical protein